MKRYKVLRRDFLKIIVITTVCALLASCGAKNPVTAVLQLQKFRRPKFRLQKFPPQKFQSPKFRPRKSQPQRLKRERSLCRGTVLFQKV